MDKFDSSNDPSHQQMKLVCSQCFEDEDIAGFIAEFGGPHGCSFCGQKDAPTAPLEDVAGHRRGSGPPSVAWTRTLHRRTSCVGSFWSVLAISIWGPCESLQWTDLVGLDRQFCHVGHRHVRVGDEPIVDVLGIRWKSNNTSETCDVLSEPVDTSHMLT